MEERELLGHAISVLRRVRVPYFVTGSVASGVWGEARFTNDIDIVAKLSSESLDTFCAGFPSPEFYISDIGAQSAVRNGGQFNIIHPDTGLKIDVIVPQPSTFDDMRFSRRKEVKDRGVDGCFGSPEDIILSKLLFYKEGQSDKHLRDITGILKLCPQPLDFAYIEKWATTLDVLDIWQAVRARLAAP